MHRYDTIEFVETERVTKPFDVSDQYTVRKDRPLVWLQRACCWVLKKLGAFQVDYNVTFNKHVIKPLDFMEAVFRQRNNLAERFNIRPTRMLIGMDEYKEAMSSREINRMFSFNTEYVQHERRGDHYTEKIMGLEVIVVPWMKGILLLPSDYDKYFLR